MSAAPFLLLLISRGRSAHAAGDLAHLHFIQKSYSNEASRRAGTITSSVLSVRGRTQTRSGPVGPPSRVLSAGFVEGGHRAGYLLAGIWLKCARPLSLRVPLCGAACHYLQMGAFTPVGHVSAGCDANSWTHQRESLSRPVAMVTRVPLSPPQSPRV